LIVHRVSPVSNTRYAVGMQTGRFILVTEHFADGSKAPFQARHRVTWVNLQGIS